MRGKDLIAFLAITFALGYTIQFIWMIWFWPTSIEKDIVKAVIGRFVLGALLMYSPFIGALVAIYLRGEKIRRGLELHGLTFPRISMFMLGAVIPLIMYVIAVVIAFAMGMPLTNPVVAIREAYGGNYTLAQILTPEQELVITIIAAFLSGITINLVYALGEEMGWRGYLLDRFIQYRGLYLAATIIGIIWGLWHAPLILVKGYNYPHHPDILGLTTFIGFCIAASIVFSQLRVLSKSVVPCAAAHGVINAFGGLMLYTMPKIDELISIPVGLLGILSLLCIALALMPKVSRVAE